MNIDGSFKDVQGIGGTRAIIRDSNGSFIAGSCFYLEHVGDASISEIMVLKEGLLLAQRIGCSSLIIHSDSLVVVETMRMGISLSMGAPIYDECFALQQEFDAISIEHCDREANSAAHEIARVALSLKENCT
jgi:ribonuclease HI